jgi:transcriptional regulator with XRE-family HTH domain
LTNWRQVRNERLELTTARAGYERARRSFEIGARVRELRTARGLTQSQLAAQVGTSQSALARLEAGGVEPRISTLEAIGAALGVKLIVDLVESKRAS